MEEEVGLNDQLQTTYTTSGVVTSVTPKPLGAPFQHPPQEVVLREGKRVDPADCSHQLWVGNGIPSAKCWNLTLMFNFVFNF